MTTTRWVISDTATKTYWSVANVWDASPDNAQLYNYFQAEKAIERIRTTDKKVTTPGTIEILNVEMTW